MAVALGDAVKELLFLGQALLYNKVNVWTMAEVALADLGFNFPIILSAYYTGCNWAGASVFYRENVANPPRFTRRQWALVILLSVCTALNTLIGRKNISVPTTFDQMLQAAGPIVVVLLVTRIFCRSVSSERKAAIIPITLGVAMAWFTEVKVSLEMFFVSASCLTLNAMKLVIWSEMLTGDHKVTPLHLLSRVSPITFAQVGTYAFIRGELAEMLGQWSKILSGWAPCFILVTGVVSFVLTVMSMHATKFATPLTVSVLGGLKQIAVIFFKVWIDRRPISRLNILGIILVAAGGARYTVVSANERRLRERTGTKANAAGQKQGTSNGGSIAPLLPLTTTVNPAETTINGKRPRKKGKGENGAGAGPRANGWDWRWWGGGRRRGNW